MGGKAIRRREKNYKAAHDGGNSTRLPPPPDSSSIDALPSKLRKIMSLAGSSKLTVNLGKKKSGDGADKGAARLAKGTESNTTGTKRKRDDEVLIEQWKEQGDEKKKKKRKGKKANDLRFKDMDVPAAGSRRKERKKKLLEAKKKKQQNAKIEEDLDFVGREEIQFGDIVQAPPKLTVPKAFKATSALDASHERLRLQAVEAYRKRKGWESRPGVKLSAPVTTTSFF